MSQENTKTGSLHRSAMSPVPRVGFMQQALDLRVSEETFWIKNVPANGPAAG